VTVEDGRDRFFFGDLMDARHKLGLSKVFLADILGVSPGSLYRWETHGMMARLNARNAEMVSIFLDEADRILEEFPDFPERFVTYPLVAQRMGVPTEWLLEKFRQMPRVAELTFDAGVLGLFVERSKVNEFRRAARAMPGMPDQT
jgi:transcriptional regulator with XRE-family HTH domain